MNANKDNELYRIKEEHIKVVPLISNDYVEQAFWEGYTFIREELNSENGVFMIRTTCSQNNRNINQIPYSYQNINADVITKQGVVSYRINF